MKPRLTGAALLAVWLIASSGPVHAQVRGEVVAVGRDLINSTVNIGIPPEQLDRLVRERTRLLEDNIALLREKLDINSGQVRVALEIVGEADVPPERLGAKLVEVAEHMKRLLATPATQSGDNPKVAALRAEARRAFGAGDMDKADALLADAEAEQERERDRQALGMAETSALRGEMVLTRLRYAEAAAHFAKAAAQLSPNGAFEDKRIGYLKKEADALYQQGNERVDRAALLAAIERYRRLLALMPRERVPGEWAGIQDSLGIALFSLGRIENGTETAEQAVAAFQAALSERTRERDPLLWADTQSNFANALASVGMHESGTTKLEAAIAAHRQALSEMARERVPSQWAQSQANLGIALTALGVREENMQLLEQAVGAFRLALEEFTRQRAPFNWAHAQSLLGAALFAIGSRETGSEHLVEALAAYREALQEETRELVPIRWAVTQELLGMTLTALGEREDSIPRLEEAVACHREALKVFTRESAPGQWLSGQSALAGTLFKLGSRESGSARLEEAVAAYRDVLNEQTRARAPLDWAMTQTLIGQVLATLGARENGTVRLEQAAAAFREALEERTRERAPLDWASTQGTLAAVLAALGARESGTARLHEASVAYREALKEQTRERAPQQFALIQTGLGGVLVLLAEREGGTAYLDEAVAAYRAALQETTEDGGRLDLLIKLAEAKASLGYALYDGGDFAAASLNFREAAALNFRDLADGPSAYPMLWLYLADTRSGAKDAKSHLQESATRLKSGEWPFPVVELYLGRRGPGGMITPGMTPAERCEAQFYLGQWHLLQKKPADAIQALRSAVEACPKDFNEYAGAVAELKRLGR